LEIEMTDMNSGSFWNHYEQGCNELRGVQTVDEVMRICKSHYGSSSGEALFPGGSGDEDLFSILLDAGRTPAWIQAGYYFAIRQPDSRDGLTYIEGDLERGVQEPI
jgi:hypothetical protein